MIKTKEPDVVQKAGRFRAEAHNVIAASLVNQEKYEEARQQLEQALEAEPGNAYATQTLEQLKPAANGGAAAQKK